MPSNRRTRTQTPTRAVKFSKAERKLRGLMPRGGGRITTEELTKRFYAPVLPPINGRVYVTNLIRSIKRKTAIMQRQGATVTQICGNEGSGRRSLEIWLA